MKDKRKKSTREKRGGRRSERQKKVTGKEKKHKNTI